MVAASQRLDSSRPATSLSSQVRPQPAVRSSAGEVPPVARSAGYLAAAGSGGHARLAGDRLGEHARCCAVEEAHSSQRR
jgi:hypothetical protein